MTAKIKISALLIGAGQMGAGYDRYSSSLTPALTHLRALQQTQTISDIDIVDSDRNALSQVSGLPKVRNCTCYLTDNLIAQSDIIIVATPSSTHTPLLKKISHSCNPSSIIICEKPAVTSETDLTTLDKLSPIFKNKVFVNYSRRWSEDHIGMRELIKKQKHGALKFVSCIYDKGLLNNGVHLIEYLQSVVGGQLETQWIGNPIFDYGPKNPTVSLNLLCGSTPVFIIGNDSRNYSIFEIKFYFEEATIALTDSGRLIETETKQTHSTYNDYTVLAKSSSKNSDLLCSLDNLYSYIFLKDGISNFQQAIGAERFCLNVIRSFFESKENHGSL